MERSEFEHEMMKAEIFIEAGDRIDYWEGYRRGLRRRYHGENFGTPEEHKLWMSRSDDLDQTRSERGRGYRDGYHGRSPILGSLG